MKLRKYNDFVKSINEDVDPIITPDSMENNIDPGVISTNKNNIKDSSNLIDNHPEEEEHNEWEGAQKMKKLSNMLGVDIKDNRIEYDGKIINYWSETENFHIGKDKFKTPDEVVNFLKKSKDINYIPFEKKISESFKPNRRKK